MRSTADQERDSAVERLEAALVEQDRLGERFDAAIGTSTELRAYARLRGAGDEVRARQAWVNWVEDASYRGLNAGPFELLEENDDLARAGEPEGRHGFTGKAVVR